ncbi:multimerin-2a, partial [Notothenia coriiceps]|uniref:Multimerin-2a n=1 Tax=Notothenia coriiceps TaxID=8208 RepID=A0A6I9PEI4_9TELE
ELDAPSTPQIVALILSQLQPLLQGFNRSLELLTRQVGDLARDVAQLKSLPLRDEILAEPQDNPGLDEATEQRLEAKLEDHIREVQRHLEDQRSHMEHRLHSQHAMLHYNLTNFKTDIDVNLKRNQKMLQVSLQAMNATLTELKLVQDLYQDLDQDQDLPSPPSMSTRRPLMQSSDTAALWEAVERLDNMVVNNTVKTGWDTSVRVAGDRRPGVRGVVRDARKQVKEKWMHVKQHGCSFGLMYLSLLLPGMVSDQPSSSSSSSHPLADMRRSSSSGSAARERQQLLLQPGGDGGDLWKLEQRVEELGLKLLSLQEEREAPPAGVEAKLQAEVQWLRRGLEEHLKVFKNVFSNADVLMSSDASLQLDQLWHLLKEKQGRKERKRGGHKRSRREDSGSVSSPVVAPGPSSLSGASLLIVAGSPRSVSSVLVFETSLNRDQVYSDSGVFTAPLSGVYLFSLTLDLRPGPTQVMLRRGGAGGVPMPLRRRGGGTEGPVTGAVVLPLRRGEEVRLEIKEGSLRESRDTVFNVLLLHQTT